MIRCREIVDFLSDYIDGDLERAVRDEFDKHLNGCSNCRHGLDTMRRTVSLYGRLDVGEIPDDLKERLKTFLEARLKLREP